MSEVAVFDDLWEFVWPIPTDGRFTALMRDPAVDTLTAVYIRGLPVPEGAVV